MPELDIKDLSRAIVISRYTQTGNTNDHGSQLYEATSAGCLQRIADSLEKMQDPYTKLQDEITALTAKLNATSKELTRVYERSQYRRYQIQQLEKIVRNLGGRIPNWRKYQ